MSRNTVKLYRRLLGYLKAYWLAFAAAILGNILYAAVDAGFVKFLEPLLNEGFVGRNEAFIRMVPWLVIGIFTLRGVASVFSTYCMGWVGRQIIYVLRKEVFDKLLRLPASFYDKQNGGSLISKITFNVEQVALASTDVLTILVRETSTALALLVVMCTISWKLTLLFLLIVPLVAGTMQYVSSRSRRLGGAIQDSMGDVTHVASEAIEGYQLIRLYGGDKYERGRFDDASINNRRQEMKLITTTAISVPLIQLFGSFALALTIYLATKDPGGQGMGITPGGFTAMLAAMIALLKPIKQLTKVNVKIQRGLAGAESVFNFLDEAEECDSGAKTLQQAKGAISFDDVSFTYEGTDKPALDRVSFDVAAGQTIALVGESGSGKTTLAKLLPRFYECRGDIKLDGTSIKDIALSDLRSQFSFVSQHVTLFNDTLANNIAYGMDGDFTEAQIIEAAKDAYAWEFIEKMPEGLQTLVGDNGLKLSGGQRQRIAIARAILKNAPVLILDEATSALDVNSERMIQAALQKIAKDRTTLIIAHRLSTIEHADNIIVFDQGQIVEMGTHQGLLALGGRYAQLHQMDQQEAVAG